MRSQAFAAEKRKVRAYFCFCPQTKIRRRAILITCHTSRVRPVSSSCIMPRFSRCVFSRRASVALSVPSAVIPMQRNVLLNIQHPDFRALSIDGPFPFPFDTRLV